MDQEQSDTLRIVVERHLAAPAEAVFDAWLDPGTAGTWLFSTPDGEMERVEIEPRVGGRLRFDERRGDELAQHHGEYLEIDRPRRLAFTFATMPEEDPSLVTVEIEPEEGGSHLTLTHEMDAKWAEYEDRTRDGWITILTGLDEHLTGDRAMVITRVIEAPRERIFEAFTDPDQVDRWWGPDGFTTTTHEMDVRQGGLWLFTMHGPDGTDHANWVRYLEVPSPRRLVWDQGEEVDQPPWFRSTVTLEEDGPGQTLVTLRTVFPTAKDRDHAVDTYDAVEGGKQTLARLAGHVEGAP